MPGPSRYLSGPALLGVLALLVAAGASISAPTFGLAAGPTSTPMPWPTVIPQHKQEARLILDRFSRAVLQGHTKQARRYLAANVVLIGMPVRVSASQDRLQPPACAVTSLHASAVWQGVMGSIAGTITLRNQGSSNCLLAGFPRVSIVARGGRVPSDQQYSPAGPAGFPVGSTELVPGQALQVYVQWENLCRRVWPPVRLAVTLPAGGRLVAPLAGGPKYYGGAGDPRCGRANRPSDLLVSSFQPAFDPGVVNLLGFYGMINRRAYADAYATTIDSGVTRAQFAAGYRRTAHVTVSRIAVPTYRVRRGDAAYACVGIELSATQVDGSRRPYGGWIMSEVRVEKVSYVVIAGSRMRLDGSLVVPPPITCSAAIPGPTTKR